MAPLVFKRRAWNHEEDSILLALVNACDDHGTKRVNWEVLAEKFQKASQQVFGQDAPRRNAKSCRLRYVNQLVPGVKHGALTPEEQEFVDDQVERIGKRWSKIAMLLPGRSDNQVKNYWYGKHSASRPHRKLGPGASTSSAATTTTSSRPKPAASNCPSSSSCWDDDEGEGEEQEAQGQQQAQRAQQLQLQQFQGSVAPAAAAPATAADGSAGSEQPGPMAAVFGTTFNAAAVEEPAPEATASAAAPAHGMLPALPLACGSAPVAPVPPALTPAQAPVAAPAQAQPQMAGGDMMMGMMIDEDEFERALASSFCVDMDLGGDVDHCSSQGLPPAAAAGSLGCVQQEEAAAAPLSHRGSAQSAAGAGTATHQQQQHALGVGAAMPMNGSPCMQDSACMGMPMPTWASAAGEGRPRPRRSMLAPSAYMLQPDRAGAAAGGGSSCPGDLSARDPSGLSAHDVVTLHGALGDEGMAFLLSDLFGPSTDLHPSDNAYSPCPALHNPGCQPPPQLQQSPPLRPLGAAVALEQNTSGSSSAFHLTNAMLSSSDSITSFVPATYANAAYRQGHSAGRF